MVLVYLKSHVSRGMLMFLPQFRTNVSPFESVFRLVPAKLWNFLEARMLYMYDKCIENQLWSYQFYVGKKCNVE